MNGFLEELAARRRFGMKPGLDTIRAVCAALGDPQQRVQAIHIAGTNGKGAVAAMLDSCLRAAGLRVGRYTSPHLVSLNERFFLDGCPVADETLEQVSSQVMDVLRRDNPARFGELTFFEALTAVAFELYAREKVDCAVLETGLGGRLDATNICTPALTVITRIGLDHCDWLGDTVEKIALEKAGIIKTDVPVVLGENTDAVRCVIQREANLRGAPFLYAPDLISPADIPPTFSLAGSFNRENAVTALAALQVLALQNPDRAIASPEVVEQGLASVVWPGRFQRVGDVLIDGAHNPPAAKALAAALTGIGIAPKSLALIVGFCGDKDVDETLKLLAPFVRQAFAVRTSNPRAMEPEELVLHLTAAGIPARACPSLTAALTEARADSQPCSDGPQILACGSLFLAGEMLQTLGASPWDLARKDPSEFLHPQEAPRS